MTIKKIAVVGPESTGKSTISEQLANYYQTVLVPEYAREYCGQLTEACTWQDEINMFYGQLELEKELLPQTNNLLICDTTFITVKIWCDHIFGKTPQKVLDMLIMHRYDYYLLMNIDLPWQEDPLRDFPDKRQYFMDIWHQELKTIGASYIVISGSSKKRLENAISAVDRFLEY